MRIFKDFNEVKAAVGTEVGVSDWVEVTQQRIDQFAQATGDEQWTHVDEERATRLAPGIVHSVMGVKGIKKTLNYGANRIRYLTPSARGSKLAR